MQLLDLEKLQYYDGKIKTYFAKTYASLASPSFTGTPTSTTPSAGDSSTKIATTKYVQTELETAKVASAGEFTAAKSVTLTGDVTGTASSKGGWSIAATLASSGVTADTYGPSANASPTHSGTFTVPKITVDAKGRVTSASNITITLPASGNVDTKVTQTVTANTDEGKYPILAKNVTATATITDTSRFVDGITIQPSTGAIQATKFIGALEGNASTATKLATARNINGTSFNGTSAITTANWGTARNISISDADGTNTGDAISVNGSAAVTLKLPSTIKASLEGNASSADSVPWSGIDGKPSTFAPSSHNQASSTINAMTGYSKPSSTGAIATTDSLNAAIGKLEKALDGKQASGSYAAASHSHASSEVTAMTGYSKPSSTSAIGTSDTLNAAIGKLEKALDGKQASGSYAAASHNHDASNINSGTLNAARIPNLDASKITSGTIDIARLPAGALERLVTVADQTARFALTSSDVQLGDTVRQSDTGLMYYVVDTSKLSSTDGYAEYTAGAATSVPWSGVTSKPSTFTPSAHNQASNTINAMTGYSKPSSTSAIGTSDTLNAAIGKLEKALDGKQASGSYAAASHNQASSTINAMTGYSKPSSTSAIGTSDTLNAAIGKLEKALDSKANAATTLAGYNISDAKIASGVITLGSNTITPLTSSSSLDAAKLTGTASVSTTGNAATVTGTAGTSALSWNTETTLYTVGGHAIKAKLPANPNSDTKVKQYVGNTSTERPILSRYTIDEASQTANYVVYDTGVTNNPNKHTLTSSGGFIGKLSGTPEGTTFVAAVTEGKALVNATTTGYGGIWNAPTKNYRVGCSTYPSSGDDVRIAYSVTNANVTAGTNTVAKSLTWNADSGTLTATAFSGPLTGNVTGNVSGNAATVTGTAGTSALAWNSEVTLYTIGGHAVKAKLPANPNTNTTYTFATGDSNGQIKVTPSGGSAQNVSVKGLGTAAYTASTDYATSGHTHSYLPLAGGTVTGTLILSRNTDADGLANNKPALIVGGADTAAHIEIDANEVMAKGSGTTTGALYLNTQGGDIYLGGNTADYKSVTGRGKGSSKLPVYTDANGIVTACGTSLDVSITGTAAKATGDGSGNTITSTYAKLASPALTGTPTAPTAANRTNTTQIATTAFVSNNAAKHLTANTTIYASTTAAGNGSGSSAANAMSLTDLQTYLGAARMQPATTSLNGSYRLTILFVPTESSYGDVTFDFNKMSGVRYITIGTSTGTASTTSNYTTNSPLFNNLTVSGSPLSVTVNNIQVNGTIAANYGAQIVLGTYAGFARLYANQYARIDVGNGTYNIHNAGTNALCYSGEYGQIILNTATMTFNFREQCYYNTAIFASDTHGRIYLQYGRAKFSGTKPVVSQTVTGTKTGTSATAAGTAAKAVTLADGQTFTLANNAVAYITFDNTNTAANPTLNINSTGAKAIYYNGAAIPAAYLNKHVQYKFTYNGTQYVCNNVFQRVEQIQSMSMFSYGSNYNTTYNSGSWNWDGYSRYWGNGCWVNNVFQGSLNGNSATTTKLATARDINISDADGTNTGTKISFDGSAAGTIKLPATIKANITGNVSGSSGSCTGNAATVTGTAGTSTLAWNSEVTLYTVGGHAIKAKLPANPNTNTTYTFATGDSNGQIKVTPSGGSAQNVSVKGLGTAAYTASTDYATSGHTHSYLPLSGGTMTGNITMSASKSLVFDLSATTPTASTVRNLPIQFKSQSTAGDFAFAQNPFWEIPSTQTANNGMGIGFGAGGLTIIGGGEAGKSIVPEESLTGTSEKVILASDNGIDFYTNCNTIANRVKTSIDTSGNFSGKAATATKLATARTINGVSFDGSANITVADSTKLPLAGGTLTGDLVISKSSPLFVLKATNITKNTAPSANYTPVAVEHRDSANSRLWGIYYNYNTDKQSYVRLIVNKGNTTDNTWTGIGVGYDKDGNWFTYAPTPAAGDSTTKIATTAFVNTKCGNYVPLSGGTMTGSLTMNGNSKSFIVKNDTYTVSLQVGSGGVNRGLWDTSLNKWMVYADASTVHLNGNAATATKLATARTINGVSFDGSANITVADSTKLPLTGGTMTGNITVADKSILFKDADMAYNAAPSANVGQGAFYWLDKNGKYVSRWYYWKNTDKSMGFSLGICKHGTTNDDGYTTIITGGHNADGVAYAACPTPPAGESSTKIATTAWVRASANGGSPSFTGRATISNGSTYTTAQNGVLIAWRYTGWWGGTGSVKIGSYTYNLGVSNGNDYSYISVPVNKGVAIVPTSLEGCHFITK